MVRLKRRRHYKTSDSRHHYRKYPNLIAGVVPSRPNEIWVSDITYVEIRGDRRWSMLSIPHNGRLFTYDSRLGRRTNIRDDIPVGGHEDGIVGNIDNATAKQLIHHSDRGCQYCSNEYVAELKRRGGSISMTQSGDPLENAVAERANGILKVEWLYKMAIATRDECRSVLERIIRFYNTERPHMSIVMQTPEVVHQQEGFQRRCWKNNYAME